MGVLSNAVVFGHEYRPVVPGGGDDKLVSRIAVKRLGQAAALDQDGAREFGQMEPGRCHCDVEPLIERPVQHELTLLDLRGEFPHRDERDPERLVALLFIDNEERRIRGRLEALAEAASAPAGETELARMARVARLASFFADDVTVEIGEGLPALQGKESILVLARIPVADGHGGEVPARLTALGIPRRQQTCGRPGSAGLRV